MMKLERKHVLGLLAVLVVIALTVVGLRPRAVPSDVVTVSSGPLVVTLDEEGETRVHDRYVVSAPVAGRVRRIELDPGDDVRANETVLATFRPSAPSPLDARAEAEARAAERAAAAALGRAEALRQQAQAELAYARTELERIRSLADEGIVSVERLETAQLGVETRQEALGAADFAVRTARGELEAARARLLETGADPPSDETLRILSPVDGVVLRTVRESEAVVAAGEPLVEVGNARDLEIVADYLSSDAVQMRPGNRVLIERWGGPRPLAGHVRRVEPSGFTKVSALGVEEQRVNVIIDFDSPVEERPALGDGFRVEVRVVVWEEEDVLQVPTGSLFRSGEQWSVYRLEGGRARLQSVEVGARNARSAQILGGLSAGDEVVVHPSDSLADGVRVQATPVG